MLVLVQYFKSSSLIFLNVKGTSFNDTFVICRWQLIKSIKTCCHLSQDETTMTCLSSKHTHISRCAESTAESDRFVFIPCTNYIELHQYLASVLLTEKLISSRLSFHLPKNTSTHQPLSVVTFLSTSLKRTSPSITITQQKRLCAESNYIRREAGSDKQAERSDSWSDWWLFITHATENKPKSNRRRIKLLSCEKEMVL